MQTTNRQQFRILMVLGSLQFGGAEILNLSILKNINRDIFHIDFAVTKLTDSPIEKEIRKLGSSIYVLPSFKAINYFEFKKTWENFLKEHHFDIVHGHASGAMSIYLSVAKKCGCKTIAHSHSGSFTGNFFVKLAKRFYSSGIIKNSDYLIACSNEAARNLFGKKYKTLSNYSFVPNGIDVDLFAFNPEARETLRKELDIPQDTILFGHVGRFISVKNHMFLLNIFHKIIKKNKNARLLLCGEGPLSKKIHKFANKLKINEYIIYYGTTPNINNCLWAMDMFLLPSLFEGLPITLVEAQAAGLEIVCSDSVTKEVAITDGIHYLPLSKKPDFWAETCIQLAGLKRDRVKDNDLVKISSFTIQNLVSTISDIYIKILK